jgi:hypothetical protein
MASKKRPPPRPPRKKQQSAVRGTRSKDRGVLDAAGVRQAVAALIDLAAAWELSRARGAPTARNHSRADTTALRKATAQLGAYAAGATRDVVSLALPLLVDELTSLYEDLVAGQLTAVDLRKLLQEAWSGLPAARLLRQGLTAERFSNDLALETGSGGYPLHSISGLGGPRKAALHVASKLLGRSASTGRSLKKKTQIACPFDVPGVAALRLRYTLMLLFPDLDTRRLAKLVGVAADELRASGGATASTKPSPSSWIPWPPHDVSLLGPERASAVAHLFGILGGTDIDEREWALARYFRIGHPPATRDQTEDVELEWMDDVT